MPFLHPIAIGFLAVSLALLAACTQTTVPDSPPEPPSSGVFGAIADAQRTKARHRMTSTLLNRASGFDPTGLSGYAIDAIEQEQERIEEEKYRRIDEEVEKAIAEGEALQAEIDEQERRKTSEKRRLPRRPAAP